MIIFSKPNTTNIKEHCVSIDLIKKFMKIDSDIDDNVINMIRDYVVGYAENKIDTKINLYENIYKLEEKNEIILNGKYKNQLISIHDSESIQINDYLLDINDIYYKIKIIDKNISDATIIVEQGFGESIDDVLKYKILNHILYCYENRGIDFSSIEKSFYSLYDQKSIKI